MSQPVKTMSFEVGERNEVLDEGRVVVGALAEADGAHLGERADGLGEASPDGFDAGDECGGDGAQADHHHAQLAGCGCNLLDGLFVHAVLLLLISHCFCLSFRLVAADSQRIH